MSYKCIKTCLKFSFLACLLLLLQPLAAQKNWQDVENFLQTHQKDLGGSFVVLVYKRGDSVVYKKEMGQFNSKTAAPVGSISQLFTSVLTLRLQEEGLISLEDKVSSLIKEFARYGKNYVSLLTCLTHSTGIKESGRGGFKPKSLEEEVDKYAAREIRANPTEDFYYGDLGSNIAGRFLELALKKRFDILTKQKLFTPLTMRRTTFTTLDGSPVLPAESAMTTGDDYMKFLSMLLNNGQLGGNSFLSEEALEKFKTISASGSFIKNNPDAMKSFNYAMGAWALEEENGKASAIACPGWEGAFTSIDFKKGIGWLILPKEKVKKEKTALYLELDGIIRG